MNRNERVELVSAKKMKVQLNAHNRVWLSADLHLNHEKIIGYTDRPFDNKDDMGEVLLEGINDNVKIDDFFIHAGDLHLGDVDGAAFWLNRMICKNIILLPGDHDNGYWSKIKHKIHSSKKLILANEVFFIYYVTGKIYDLPIIVCHWPFTSWRGKHYGSMNAHGHSHGFLRAPQDRQIDVGPDANNYTPVCLTTIIERFYRNDYTNPYHETPYTRMVSQELANS